MKKIFKIVVLAAASLVPFGSAFAQQSKHEFTVNGGLGLSTLNFDVNNGDKGSKVGGTFGLGYSYFFNEKFSINTGLEVAIYNSDLTAKSFGHSYVANDGEENFLFNTSVSNYKEKQQSINLNIPIMGQYQIPVLGNHRFYGAAGFKIGIPMSSSFETSGADFATSGTYTGIEGTPTIDNDPMLGFTTFKGRSVDEDPEFKLAFILALEAGMKWELSSSMSLYTGAYFDYGLNDIRDSSNKSLLVYQAPYTDVPYNQWTQNSILNSQYTKDGKTSSFTDKVVPMVVGVKVRLAFSLGN